VSISDNGFVAQFCGQFIEATPHSLTDLCPGSEECPERNCWCKYHAGLPNRSTGLMRWTKREPVVRFEPKEQK
jgi:hypothetical protein